MKAGNTTSAIKRNSLTIKSTMTVGSRAGDEGVPSRLCPLSTDSDSESEPGSNLTSDAGSLRHSSPKAQSGVKLKTKSLS